MIKIAEMNGPDILSLAELAAGKSHLRVDKVLDWELAKRIFFLIVEADAAKFALQQLEQAKEQADRALW